MFSIRNSKKLKAALLIGINYEDDEQSRLRGCINDIENIKKMITTHFNYKEDNIVMLRDDVNDVNKLPTGKNICQTFFKMALNSNKYSELWIHYSGHGISVDDKSGDEIDKKDEAIVPCDYKTSGIITDDLLYRLLSIVKCPVFIMMDCCHSATSFDLPYVFIPKQIGERVSFVKENHLNKRYRIRNKNIYALSGCRDNQTSSDAYFNNSKEFRGAFTDSLIRVLNAYNFNIRLSTLYIEILKYLKINNFEQETRLSSSNSRPDLIINPKQFKNSKWYKPWKY